MIPLVPLSLPRDLDAPCAPETQQLAFDDLTKALAGLTKWIEEFRKPAGCSAIEPNRIQTDSLCRETHGLLS
jgi:hypothetical protein